MISLVRAGVAAALFAAVPLLWSQPPAARLPRLCRGRIAWLVHQRKQAGWRRLQQGVANASVQRARRTAHGGALCAGDAGVLQAR